MQPNLVQVEAEPAHGHDADFGKFDAPGKDRLVVFVGKLTGEGREQEVGRNEERRAQGNERGAIDAKAVCEIVDDQNADGVAQAIVIEGAKCLSDEQRQEPPRREQRELARRRLFVGDFEHCALIGRKKLAGSSPTMTIGYANSASITVWAPTSAKQLRRHLDQRRGTGLEGARNSRADLGQ